MRDTAEIAPPPLLLPVRVQPTATRETELARVTITDFSLFASYLDLRIDSKMPTGPHAAVRLI